MKKNIRSRLILFLSACLCFACSDDVPPLEDSSEESTTSAVSSSSVEPSSDTSDATTSEGTSEFSSSEESSQSISSAGTSETTTSEGTSSEGTSEFSSSEETSEATSSEETEPEIESYSFSGVDSGEGSYSYPDQSEGTSREPFVTSYESESEEPIPSNPSIPSSTSSQTSGSSESSSSGSSEEVNPSNVRYGLTDLPTGSKLDDYYHVTDTAYFAALATNLAGREIANLGFEVFSAFAIIPGEDEESSEDDYLIPGLAFTAWNVYSSDAEAVVYSCGFMQVIAQGETPEKLLVGAGETLDEGMNPKETIDVSGGICVYPQEDDNNRFIIESNAFLDGFSGVYMNTFFSYKQTSAFSMEIDVHEAKGELEDYADEDLDCYSYDEKQYLYKASLFKEKTGLGAYALYGTKASEAYEKALQIIDQSIKMQEENGLNIALNSFVLFSEDLFNKISFDTQREAIQGRLASLLRNQLVEENQYLVVTYDEAAADFSVVIATDNNYLSSEAHLANGIIKSLTALLMIAGGVTAIVATGGAASPLVLGAMYATIGVAMTYAASELVAGISEAYYKDDEHIINPILDGLTALTGDRESAEKIYHAVGIVSNIAVSFFAPISSALSTSVQLTSGIRAIAQTAIIVAKTVAIHAVKLVITATVSKFVYRLAEKIALKVGASEEVAKLVGFASALVAGVLVYSGLSKIQQALSTHAKVTNLSESELRIARQEISQHGDLKYGDAIKSNYRARSYYSRSALIRDHVNQMTVELNLDNPVQLDYCSSQWDYLPSLAKYRIQDGKAYSPCGTYDPSTNTIYLFPEKIEENGAETLRSLAHLMRHAYQFAHAEFNSPVEKGLRKGAYEAYSDVDPSRLNPAEEDAKAYADYILERANAAFAAWQENPDIEKVLNDKTFPDPDTYKEVAA